MATREHPSMGAAPRRCRICGGSGMRIVRCDGLGGITSQPCDCANARDYDHSAAHLFHIQLAITIPLAALALLLVLLGR